MWISNHTDYSTKDIVDVVVVLVVLLVIVDIAIVVLVVSVVLVSVEVISVDCCGGWVQWPGVTKCSELWALLPIGG